MVLLFLLRVMPLWLTAAMVMPMAVTPRRVARWGYRGVQCVSNKSRVSRQKRDWPV